MSKQDYIQLTLFQEGSLASHSPKPGSEEARKMTVTSGRNLSGLYGNSGPLGSLVKMCLESSIWHSTRCLLTWRRKVTKSNVSLFQLAVSMPRTEESGSQLWPTPSTGASLCGGTGSFKTLLEMVEKGMITEEERRNLSQGNGGNTNPVFVEWLMGYEGQFTKLIPTPTSTDYKGGCMSRCWMPDSQTVQVERESGLRRTSAEPGRGFAVWENWPAEPNVGRVAHGVPNRVDRLKCLGNAVVPQQFYPIFEAIARVEEMTWVNPE